MLSSQPDFPRLPARLTQVWWRMQLGLDNDQIASQLGTSPRTVANQVTRLGQLGYHLTDRRGLVWAAKRDQAHALRDLQREALRPLLDR